MSLVDKWKPILESIGIKDKNKYDIISSYLENSNDVRMLISSRLSPMYSITSTSQLSNLDKLNNDMMRFELLIFSKINIDNKMIMIRGVNDNKLTFYNPHPSEKYSLSIQRTQEDFKTVRKDKINNLNNLENLEIEITDKLLKIASNIIITDINDRLSEGQILYIDETLINIIDISTSLYNPSIQFIAKYDII